jgi:hypothetical protein
MFPVQETWNHAPEAHDEAHDPEAHENNDHLCSLACLFNGYPLSIGVKLKVDANKYCI